MTALAPKDSELWKDLIGIGGLVAFSFPLAVRRGRDKFMQSVSLVGAVYIWFGLFGAVRIIFFLSSPILWSPLSILSAIAVCLAIAFVGIKIYHSNLFSVRIGIVLAALQTFFFAVFAEKILRSGPSLITSFPPILGLIFSLGMLTILSLAPTRITSAAKEPEQNVTAKKGDNA